MALDDPDFTDEVRITNDAHGGNLTRGFLRSAENRDKLWVNAPDTSMDFSTAIGWLIEIIGAFISGDRETAYMHMETLGIGGYGNRDEYVDPGVAAASRGEFQAAAAPPPVGLNSEYPEDFVHTIDAASEYGALLDRLAITNTPLGSYASTGGATINEDLTGMTINDVLALAEDNPDIRFGRYGIEPDALRELVEANPRITLDTAFSTSTQDMLGVQILETAGIEDFQGGEITREALAQAVDGFVTNFLNDDEAHNTASLESLDPFTPAG